MITEYDYITQYTDPKSQLVAINAVISALNDTVLGAASSNGSTLEYQFDDGQMKVRAQYNTILDVVKAIHFYNQEAQRMLAQINGRFTKFIPCRRQ